MTVVRTRSLVLCVSRMSSSIPCEPKFDSEGCGGREGLINVMILSIFLSQLSNRLA